MAAAACDLVRRTAALYPATIFLGAFLLFQVQPLLSKTILPWFGGGPAVWTTCLIFFQTALFGGYVLAHASERFLRGPARLAAQLGFIVLAVALPPFVSGGPGGDPPTWAILRLLAVGVGVPYLLLSSTGPLVQAWFARTNPGRPPYRLYALSNAGSLAALLSYPVLVEPRWGLKAQAAFWTWGFRGFAVLLALGAIAARAPAAASLEEPDEPAPSKGRCALWVLLPALASAMLVATTEQICQDVAVLPFLWVLPLAAYLVTFIVAFDHPRWYRPQWIAPLAALLAFAAAWLSWSHVGSRGPVAWSVGTDLAALFCVGLLCHGELAGLAPAPGRLTGYYLAVAGGGALGGLAVSLGAPLLFSSFVEWKLGIGLIYVGAWAVTGWIHRGALRAHLNLAVLMGVVSVTGFVFLLAFLGSYRTQLESARNFYGVVSVERSLDGESNQMVNGRVLHGAQFLDEKRRRIPGTYYSESSGVGRAMALLRFRDDLRVGVVGLGTGSLAAYAGAESQTFRFYEINPEVTRLARSRFTYLPDCKGRVEVVPGDARLSLEREAPRGYHLLALDAFSGHSIPTHLLTQEAMDVYLRHLAPDGILAVHISNQFLDLAPVVRGAARRRGLRTMKVDDKPAGKSLGVSSTWMLCTASESQFRLLRGGEADEVDERAMLWTDDASDLFSILKRN